MAAILFVGAFATKFACFKLAKKALTEIKEANKPLESLLGDAPLPVQKTYLRERRKTEQSIDQSVANWAGMPPGEALRRQEIEEAVTD